MNNLGGEIFDMNETCVLMGFGKGTTATERHTAFARFVDEIRDSYRPWYPHVRCGHVSRCSAATELLGVKDGLRFRALLMGR